MRATNIHEAETRLSRLVDEAARGEPFIIAKAGKPMVQAAPLPVAPELEPRKPWRIGFMEGQFTVPDDFNTTFEKEIEEMFYGEPERG